jgi:FkbM family methyltransferase
VEIYNLIFKLRNAFWRLWIARRLLRVLASFVGRDNLSSVLRRTQLSDLSLFQLDGGDASVVASLGSKETDRILILGGYIGDSVERFSRTPHSEIIVLEPIDFYFTKLQHRFRNSKEIKILNVGVGYSTRSETLYSNGQTTSSFDQSGSPEIVSLVDISSLLDQIGTVDILEINIEGGEYEVLQRLIEIQQLSTIRTLIIQFHAVVGNHEELRALIRTSLRQTHKEVFNYHYVWERWDRVS